MISTLFMLLIFVGTASLVAALGSLFHEGFLRDRWQVQQRLSEAFSPEEKSSQRTLLFRDLKMLHAQTSGPQLGMWNQFVTIVEQSGLSIPPLRVPFIGAVMGLLAGGATYLWSPLPLLAIPAGAMGFLLPFVYVKMRREARMLTLCQQLPGAFDQMKRAVRAGQSVPAAMQLVANDLRAPIADEFAVCCQQLALGLPFRTALQDLARRTGVMELQILTVALLVQRESGGNCVEVLSNLSDVVRKRLHLSGRVKSLTSEGRLQAIVLSLLPIAAFLAILFINPQYANVLLQRPYLLAGIAASEIVGTLWIRKIVNIEF